MRWWRGAVLAALVAVMTPLAAGAPAPPAPILGPVTVREGARLARWGALTPAEQAREMSYGRTIIAGEPLHEERRAFFAARGGVCPDCAPPPACQVEFNAEGECVGWRYGPPAPSRAGYVAMQREPTLAEQAQLRARNERRQDERALVRALVESEAAGRAGLAALAFELSEEANVIRARLAR